MLVDFIDNTYSNGQIEIPCTVDGNPAPAIYWYKDGQNITQHYRVTNQRLYMEGDVVNELLGVYQCFAENTAGTADTITRALLDGKKHSLKPTGLYLYSHLKRNGYPLVSRYM